MRRPGVDGRGRIAASRAAIAALGLVLASGCGPELVRQTVFENDNVRVQLRHVVDDGVPVPRGYDQPAQIAAVRITHILANLSYEDDRGKRQPIIRSEHVYDLAEGIGNAFQQATPDDEIVARAVSNDRRFGIFSDDRVTALRAVMKDGQLDIGFFAIEEPFKSDPRSGEKWEIPAVLPESRPRFTLVAAEAQTRTGPRTLAIDWRDDFYRRPVSMTVRHGEVRRRTILLESEEEPESSESAPVPSKAATDRQIQALDQLEAARRAGLVSESEFQRRRRLILQGRLEEAGYGADSP